MAQNEPNVENDDRLLARILEWLQGHEGPVAIHAGHFMLLSRGASCVPAVVEEISDAHLRDQIRDWIASFPMASWRLGVRLLARLRAVGLQGGLLTLVNDWQYIRSASTRTAAQARHQFYGAYRDLLPPYQRVLDDHAVPRNCVVRMGNHPAFVSEYWLRRHVERRLKRMAKNGPQGVHRLTWRSTPNGTKDLFFEDLDTACRLLMCGQADCSGEVMELVYRLHELGFRTLVDIIPRECEIPVNEGTRRAISLFGLHDFRAMNIAAPCVSCGLSQAGFLTAVRMWSICGARIGQDQVDAAVRCLQ